MSPRRIFPFALLVVSLVLTGIILSRIRTTAARQNDPIFKYGRFSAHAQFGPDVATDSSEPSGRLEAAQKLHGQLQQLLGQLDARPNEAVLTFANVDAYRRFLERAQHRGLAVIGQVDALLTVRVRYDSITALQSDLRDNQADFSHVAANPLVHVPGKPAVENRAAITEIPFGNSTLSFLGVADDHDDWGRGVRIAVLDSGVAPDATFAGGRVQYLDVGLGTLPGTGLEDGHGTSVASLAAGLSPDAAGVAPAASVLSIRVTDDNGIADLFTVARAIVAATDAGTPIVNLSLGGYATGPVLTAAIEYALAHGTVIVAPAGNDQAAQLAWPAADPRVISVGAVDARAQQVTFSNSGPQLQISAPGYGVQTAWLDGQRAYVDGTSASAPLVAGAIAAVMSQNPAMASEQAWNIVRQTTSDAGPPGTDGNYGAGILNLDWAMNFNNPTRFDPAIASHYYDAARGEMNFIVQNRSARVARSLSLEVTTGNSSSAYPISELSAGGIHILRLTVDSNKLTEFEFLTFTTHLITPAGMEDANLANNRLSSQLKQ